MVSENKMFKIRLISKAGLFGISVLFLLFVAVSTSPLTEFYGWDSSYFMLVGQGMTKGLLPYRDFFDMKGPYMYLIEYIAQKICWGRTGCFLMEVVHLTASLWIIEETFGIVLQEKSLKKYGKYIYIIPILFVASFAFEQGNLTEEYSLPWLLGGVYCAVRYYKTAIETGEYKHPLWMGVYYGIVFGIMALIRINNAAIIGAVILSISIGLIASREFKNLLLNGASFLLGTAISFLPMYFWYAARGLGGEMLNQVFLFGVQYSGQTGLMPKLYMLYHLRYLLLPALFPVFVCLVYCVRSWRVWLLSVNSMMIGVFAVSMGFGLVHYIALLIPNLVLGLALLLYYSQRQISKKKEYLKMGIVAVFLLGMGAAMLQTDAVKEVYRHKISVFSGKEWDIYAKEQARDIVDQVPEEERSQIYAYGINVSCCRWYVMAGCLPPNRYCDWQQDYISMRPEIGEELKQWLEQKEAWIVTQKGYSFAPQIIADTVRENYSVFYENNDYVLYKANSR